MSFLVPEIVCLSEEKKTGIKTSDTQGHEHYPSLTWKIDETQSLNSLSSSLSS